MINDEMLWECTDIIAKAIERLTRQLEKTNEKLDLLLKTLDEGLTTFVEKAE